MSGPLFKTVLFLRVISSLSSVAKTSEFDVYQNSYLDVEAFKMFSPIGMKMCVEECLKMEKCASINFEKAQLLCKLNTISHKDNSKTPSSGKVYVFINKGNAPCRTCEEYETCIQVSSGIRTCVKTECSTPQPEVTYSSYSKTFDPPSMNFTCDSGTTTVGKIPYTACVPGKSWTPIDIVCHPNCLSGWVKENGKCYLRVKSTATWSSALKKCQDLGIQASLSHSVYLAEPLNDAENTYVASIANGDSWIGVSDTSSEGIWVYSSSAIRLSFAKWGNTEPNGGRGENCVQIYRNTYWIDHVCTVTRSYICEYKL